MSTLHFKGLEDTVRFLNALPLPNPCFAPPKPTEIRPAYYHQGAYEVFRVIDAWELDFYLGNALKYIAHAGRKDPTKEVEDLRKAVTYLEAKIARLEAP